MRGLGSIGIDACSPGEVRHALEHGWSADEISFTGTNLSAADVDALVETGVHVNLDLRSQLERWGRRAPGTTVGIRVNPRAGASWSGMAAAEGESLYAKATATKFGILPEQLDDALAIAAEHGLAIDTVHAHVGDGFLTDGLLRFEVAIERVAEMTRSRARRRPRGPGGQRRAAASASRSGPRTNRWTSTPTRTCSPSTSARSA